MPIIQRVIEGIQSGNKEDTIRNYITSKFEKTRDFRIIMNMKIEETNISGIRSVSVNLGFAGATLFILISLLLLKQIFLVW